MVEAVLIGKVLFIQMSSLQGQIHSANFAGADEPSERALDSSATFQYAMGPEK